MERQQAEFSLTYFFKYALRYVLIAILCAAIGLGIGAFIASGYTPPNTQKFTAAIRFDTSAYATAMGAMEDSSEGEFLYHARHITQMTEAAKAPKVAAQTFEAQKNVFYPSMEVADKVYAFQDDFVLTPITDGLQVSFVYDASSEDAKKVAVDTVVLYLENAKANVLAVFPELIDPTFANVITISAVEPGIVLGDPLSVAPSAPSILFYALIGAVVGAVLGAALIFVLYLLDPRIKTLTTLLPAGHTTVVDVEKEGAVASFAAMVKAADVKRVLLAAPKTDAALTAFAEELSAFLSTGERKVAKVTFTAGDPSWLSYFDKPEEADLTVVLCDGVEAGVLTYVAKNTDAAAIFADRRAIGEKCLLSAADAMKDATYLCTVMHGKSMAYLD